VRAQEVDSGDGASRVKTKELGMEEIDGGGAASGDEAEELGAEEFTGSPLASRVETKNLGAEEVDQVGGDGDASGVEAKENLDDGDSPQQRRRQRRRLQAD